MARFMGQKPMTRYEAAMALARMLDKINKLKGLPLLISSKT